MRKRRGGIRPSWRPERGAGGLGGGGPSALSLSPQWWLWGCHCACAPNVQGWWWLGFFFFEGEMGVGLEETFCMSYLVDWILIFYALPVTTPA